VEIVDAPDRGPAREQAVTEMAADEPGAAGYENAHAGFSI
jgi:hypothetical protein